MVERSPGGNGPQRIDGDAARPGATAVLPAALAALVDPVVGILLLAGIFDGISGNPIHGVVLCGVAFALAVDGFGRRRGEPAPQEQAAPLFHAERVPMLLVVALAAAFAFVVGGFGRYSWPATVVVVLLGTAAVVVAWRGSLRPGLEPAKLDPAGALSWASVFIALGLWELTQLLLQPSLTTDSNAHPTLSVLSDPVLGTHPGRSVGLFLWAAFGWFLLQR